MPDNDKKEHERTRVPGMIQKLANLVQSNMDALYSKTYFTSPSNKNDLEIAKSGINKTIDAIINNNIENVGVPNITSLFSRLDAAQRDPNTSKKVTDMFNDRALMDGLISTYIENKYLRDYDDEIDTILKYCPKLLEALEVRKDNVLSADHFSKDFINVSDDMNVQDDTIFMKRCNDIKEKYNLIERTEDWYERAAKYGEVFLYIVPYKTALARLLAAKNAITTPAPLQEMLNQIALSEGYDLEYEDQPTLIEESTININRSTIESNVFESIKNEYFSNINNSVDIKVEFNMTGMLLDPVINTVKAVHESQKISRYSLQESLGTDKISNIFKKSSAKQKVDHAKPVSKDNKREIDKGIISKDNELEYDDFEKDKTSSEGLIDPDRASKTEIDNEADKIKLKTPGSVIRELDRYYVIPLYIDDLCLGYFYLEFLRDTDQYTMNTQLADPVITLKANTKLYNDAEMARQDQMLRYISGRLSAAIDAKFVNANQDLSKEIYMILKHNDTYNTPNPEGVRVTFIPPEDMEHIAFKRNPKTHRGVSDLEAALLPGKLYAGLYITNTIASMTRAQDRRVYYVKQAVDTNVSEVLLNVIDQIKKSNFNIRQIENINQVLNILGRFNDFVIPVGPNGDSPVQFEVMQGQSVDPQPELMQKLEEMAVNSTDVPLELIQARQSIDYAVQLTMTNSKFLRKVYSRQAIYQIYLSRIFTKLYNAEYFEATNIKIQLPPPVFLNITNTDQLSNNIVNLAQTITDIQIAEDGNDPNNQLARSILNTKIKRDFLKSFIDFDRMDKLTNEVLQQVSVMTNNGEEQEQ